MKEVELVAVYGEGFVYGMVAVVVAEGDFVVVFCGDFAAKEEDVSFFYGGVADGCAVGLHYCSGVSFLKMMEKVCSSIAVWETSCQPEAVYLRSSVSSSLKYARMWRYCVMVRQR